MYSPILVAFAVGRVVVDFRTTGDTRLAMFSFLPASTER
jgi:hypothetical protein